MSESSMSLPSIESPTVEPLSRTREDALNIGGPVLGSTVDRDNTDVSFDVTFRRRGDRRSLRLDTPTIKVNVGRFGESYVQESGAASRIGKTMLSTETEVEVIENESRSVDDYLKGLENSSLINKVRSFGVGGFARVFGDGSGESGYKLKPLVRMDHPYDTVKHGTIPFENGFSRALETGADIGEMVSNRPFDRHKFYLSLDLSTPEKKAQAQEFMKDVYTKAAEKSLSMLTKSEDHDYDSCNIYTWEPAEFSKILEEVYPKYKDIWLTTEHPLQGPVGEVDPHHIGMVQEPIGGYGNGSHSARMVVLGRSIDEAGGELTAEVWTSACKRAGVLPDKPWLINPVHEVEYMKKRKG